MNVHFGMPTTPRSYASKLLVECGITEPPVPDQQIADFLHLPTQYYSWREFEGHSPRGAEHSDTWVCPKGQLPLFEGSPYGKARPSATPRHERIDSLLVRKNGQRTVWLNVDSPARRLRSKRCHEFGHDYMPWHQQVGFDINSCCFNVRAIDPWEREASQFAADLLMWPDWFREDMTAFATGFHAVDALIDRYDTSLETTAIHYARLHPGRCLLLMTQLDWQHETHSAVLRVRYGIRSAAFPYFVPAGTILAVDSPIGECARQGQPVLERKEGVWAGLPTTARYKIQCRPWGPDGDVMALVWQECPPQRSLLEPVLAGAMERAQ